jgi:hypothetical protein
MKLSAQKLYTNIKQSYNYYIFIGSLESKDFYLTYGFDQISVVYSDWQYDSRQFDINADMRNILGIYHFVQQEVKKRLPKLLMLK